MKSILKPWVMELGLRHQGCLISAIRGCDGVPKGDPSKGLIRALRFEILEPHCGDAAKAASFIEPVTKTQLLGRMQKFVSNFDHYPVHFLLHILHAAEIVGYKRSMAWYEFYQTLCKKMHVNQETEVQMEARLNADEETFRKANADDIQEACQSDAYEMTDLFIDGVYKGKSKCVARMPGPPQRSADEAREELKEREAVMQFMSDPKPFFDAHPTEPIVGDPATIQRDLIREINQSVRNPNQADPSRPMSEQLHPALVKGFFDHKAMHVTLASNHYSERTEQADFQMWEIGWHCADLAKDNGYADPRPRQEGYDAYYRGVNVMSNPYQGIAKGSQEWTIGWKRAEENDKFQTDRLKVRGHICDGNRGHCAQDCPDSKENRDAGKVGPGFDGSGFYEGHKIKALDDQAARNYRGVRS